MARRLLIKHVATSEPEIMEQLQSLSENISAKSEKILARRLEILQSHAENFSKNDQENLASMSSAEMQTNQSTDKPLGFHARRLAIMHASAENKNVSENSQPALQQSLAENHSDNQSRLNTSESEACYESPRPTPYC